MARHACRGMVGWQPKPVVMQDHGRFFGATFSQGGGETGRMPALLGQHSFTES